MTPLSLGIFASANQSAAATSFESISTVTVGAGGSATVEFTSIPSTYTHLQVRYLNRDTSATAGTNAFSFQFNNDTASNYANHIVAADGGTAFASASSTQTKIAQVYTAGGGTAANCFGAGIIDILDYANTNKYKTTRTLHGMSSNNGSGLDYIGFSSGLWQSTSAITSIKFTPPLGNWAQYSSFALYGVKSA